MSHVYKLAFLAALGLLGVGGFVYSGLYHMGADDPHWPVTYRLIEILRDRSIAARSGDIEVPADLGDPVRARRGAGNYDAMCAGCHLAPGRRDSEIRKGLYPQPPNLALPDKASERYMAANQFWVIKHGLKMSGMPAWGKAGVDDASIWDMVALIPKLSSLSPNEYQRLVTSSGGHAHAGVPGQGDRMETAPGYHQDINNDASEHTENGSSEHKH